MILPRIIPCLLIEDRKLLKTIKFKSGKYIGDPLNAIRIYNECEVDELIIVDRKTSLCRNTIDFEYIEELASECFIPICYGGGIQTIEDMKVIFGLGVEKVALNSVLLDNPELIKEAKSIFGSQSIVVSCDVKKNLWGKYEVRHFSGKKKNKKELKQFIKEVERFGAGEILLHSIDGDGMMSGFDLNLIKYVNENLSLPLIVLGGAGSTEDIKDAIGAGADAVAASSIFVYNDKKRAVLINYPNQETIKKLFL